MTINRNHITFYRSFSPPGPTDSFPVGGGTAQDAALSMNASPASQQSLQPSNPQVPPAATLFQQHQPQAPPTHQAGGPANTLSYGADGASTQSYQHRRASSGQYPPYPQQTQPTPSTSTPSTYMPQQPASSTYQPTAAATYGMPSAPYASQQQPAGQASGPYTSRQQPTGQATSQAAFSYPAAAAYNPYSRSSGQQQQTYNYYNPQQFQ